MPKCAAKLCHFEYLLRYVRSDVNHFRKDDMTLEVEHASLTTKFSTAVDGREAPGPKQTSVVESLRGKLTLTYSKITLSQAHDEMRRRELLYEIWSGVADCGDAGEESRGWSFSTAFCLSH